MLIITLLFFSYAIAITFYGYSLYQKGLKDLSKVNKNKTFFNEGIANFSPLISLLSFVGNFLLWVYFNEEKHIGPFFTNHGIAFAFSSLMIFIFVQSLINYKEIVRYFLMKEIEKNIDKVKEKLGTDEMAETFDLMTKDNDARKIFFPDVEDADGHINSYSFTFNASVFRWLQIKTNHEHYTLEMIDKEGSKIHFIFNNKITLKVINEEKNINQNFHYEYEDFDTQEFSFIKKEILAFKNYVKEIVADKKSIKEKNENEAKSIIKAFSKKVEEDAISSILLKSGINDPELKEKLEEYVKSQSFKENTKSEEKYSNSSSSF